MIHRSQAFTPKRTLFIGQYFTKLWGYFCHIYVIYAFKNITFRRFYSFTRTKLYLNINGLFPREKIGIGIWISVLLNCLLYSGWPLNMSCIKAPLYILEKCTQLLTSRVSPEPFPLADSKSAFPIPAPLLSCSHWLLAMSSFGSIDPSYNYSKILSPHLLPPLTTW